ncbi:FxsA family protein [Methylophilus sp. DW102]|uniref:FxsA family protein n=1 Tax=Methylophilus sp. DW102 TaxID=3095607 RepID=UPI0030930BDE|nr:FxsA family protein [Methylophilus sp. DW102]
MRFLILAILLAFPFLEIAVLIELSQRYGWWVLVYLIIIGYLGLKLIRGEKDLIASRLFQQMTAGGNPVAAIFSTARNLLAGVLLLIPGVISDVIAVILLLIPTNNPTVSGQHQQPHARYRHSANDEVIEGEFTEVPESKPVDNVVHLPRKD